MLQTYKQSINKEEKQSITSMSPVNLIMYYRIKAYCLQVSYVIRVDFLSSKRYYRSSSNLSKKRKIRSRIEHLTKGETVLNMSLLK